MKQRVMVRAVRTRLATASSGSRPARSVSENRASALTTATRSVLSWATAGWPATGASARSMRPNRKPGRFDPSTLPPAAQAIAAGNRAALQTYAGRTMTDPGLASRLASVTVPALVLWGDSDRIVDPGYGRAYAAAIPAARFHLLTDTGHLPHLETPEQASDAIWASVTEQVPAAP